MHDGGIHLFVFIYRGGLDGIADYTDRLNIIMMIISIKCLLRPVYSFR